MSKLLLRRMLPALGLGISLTLTACSGGATAPSSGSAPPTGSAATPQLVDLSNQPPTVGALAILLTDGSVLVQGDPSSSLVVSGSVGASLFFV